MELVDSLENSYEVKIAAVEMTEIQMTGLAVAKTMVEVMVG